MTRSEQEKYLAKQGWEDIASNKWIKSEWWLEADLPTERDLIPRSLALNKAFELAQLEEEFITM